MKLRCASDLMAMALLVPSFLIFSSGPFPSLYNQAAAMGLWGLLVYLSPARPARLRWQENLGSGLWASCLVLIFLAIAAPTVTSLPWGYAFLFGAEVAAALVVIQYSQRLSGLRVERVFLWSVAVCAVVNCIPALIEEFWPNWIDGRWLAPAAGTDRVSGNIRQPNLMATMCAWGIVACVALLELSAASSIWIAGAVVVLASTVACTGSRVGLAELILLAALGMVQRRMKPVTRRLMAVAPLWAMAVWAALQWWSHASGSVHGRAPDLSSGRYVMWQQCLHLIAAHPWFGVGMGNFNFAWTLTPFDRSNPETFDHAHNLVLQWAVELGIPITLLLLGLLGRSLWLCVQRARQATGDESTIRRFCLMMVAVVLLHSMTEYPLWYAYFLLPTVFAWGIAAAPPGKAKSSSAVVVAGMEAASAAPSTTRGRAAKPPTNWLGLCGLLMALGAAFAVYDYQKIVTIYHPYDDTPIEQRVAEGRKALLYSPLADRFAGTLAVNGSRTLEPFKTATRQLLDMRLLIAWSLAMRETGHLDKARYLAQRVKDFNDPVSHQFFAPCSQPLAAGRERPWQCTPPTQKYTYEDFL